MNVVKVVYVEKRGKRVHTTHYILIMCLCIMLYFTHLTSPLLYYPPFLYLFSPSLHPLSPLSPLHPSFFPLLHHLTPSHPVLSPHLSSFPSSSPSPLLSSLSPPHSLSSLLSPSTPFPSLKVSGQDIAGLMKTWTTRMGYPYLSVRSHSYIIITTVTTIIIIFTQKILI